MRLIESKAELLQQGEGLDGLYKHIELCSRVAYKSEDKITDTSAKPFVEGIIKRNHGRCLEHGTVYLDIPDNLWVGICGDFEDNPYSKVVHVAIGEHEDEGYDEIKHYITTNMRVLQENDWLDDLKYMCEPTEYHAKRYTFRVTTSIGVTREFNRHTTISTIESSTRYCNYSKDKFDNEIKFIRPTWLNLNTGIYKQIHKTNGEGFDIVGDGYIKDTLEDDDTMLLATCIIAEDAYMSLINKGWKPQQAREVLPLCTATEICYTGFGSDWKHFFDLRLFGKTGKPHPNAEHTAQLMKEAAERAGVWEDIMNQPSKFE